MPKYIIRLDDACPNMDWNQWEKMELLLDKFNITPIVGVIPNNKDLEFIYPCKGDFWQLVRNWEDKGWTIAQHGFEHVIKDCGRQKFFQCTHEYRSEFAGKSYEEQYEMLKKGYDILKDKNITPVCFFAPAHTFDKNTVKAITELGCYRFISDGYAIRPYQKQGGVFLPSLFDTPHHFNVGIFTFVCHPNNMGERDWCHLSNFLDTNASYFVNAVTVLEETDQYKPQGLIGKCLEWGIYLLRGIRDL